MPFSEANSFTLQALLVIQVSQEEIGRYFIQIVFSPSLDKELLYKIPNLTLWKTPNLLSSMKKESFDWVASPL